jgi:RHS repeat-associated protein
MLVPNRHGSSNSYRYGFQGQEKDDELKGEGNSLNYTFRMHDPRVGRFFATDPLFKEYPELTPYQFSSNSVIDMVEIEGLEGGWIVNKIGKVQYANLGPINDTYFNSYEDATVAASFGISKPSFWMEYNKVLSRNPSVQKSIGEIRQLNFHQKYATHNPGYVMAPMMLEGAKEIVEDALGVGFLKKISLSIKVYRAYKYAKATERSFRVLNETYDTYKDYGKAEESFTAIGRMDDLTKYDDVINVDTWRKSGRIPSTNGGGKVTWPENRKWLQERIDRGDTFIMTMDPKNLPTEYIPNSPNGWFTKLEYDYLIKKEAKIEYDF